MVIAFGIFLMYILCFVVVKSCVLKEYAPKGLSALV
jgi:hypothetical protein